MKASYLIVCFGALGLLSGCSHIGPLHGYTIESSSMEPTIFKGDKVIVDDSYYSRRSMADGDLVVFRHKDVVLIKRVSAVAGETIEGKDGILIRNGHPLDEPYARHSGPIISELQNFAARTVPAGEIFVTGDNRDHSFDSRLAEFGAVHASDVTAAPTYIQSSQHGTGGRQLK
jgi:signal peptidase I